MKINKRKLSTIGAAVLASALLVSCSAGAPTDSEPTETDNGVQVEESLVLRTSTLFGPENWQTQAFQKFADEIESNSEGSLSLEFYYGDALVAPAEYTTALQSGTLDIAYTLLSYTPDLYPVGDWISRAAFQHDPSPDAGALQGAAATLDWAFSDDDYMAQFDALNILPLLPRLLAHDSYSLACTEPATTLEEVAGKRVRVGGAAWSAEAENLGMVPVDIPSTEAFTSLQQGLIDCFMGGATDVDSLGLAEAAKYFTGAGLTGYDAASVLMSKEAWNKLSDSQKDVVWEAIPVYLEAWFTGYREAQFDFVENSIANEMEVSNPDAAMRAKIDDYHASVVDEMIADAPAAVEDPAATLSNFEQIAATWGERLVDLGYSMDDETWVSLSERLDGANDISSWADAVKTNVLDPNRPN